ncbi:Hypothetical_protein [Hexamita inflata]|uniref:Hypothetical_protein n=1 Tax=Hexamita inflata TaxID=28002 RepID=A0AA86PH88_9EUKA|nr:Hypothetical protein HINF_LOCUS27155 [Hexamita inflata]
MYGLWYDVNLVKVNNSINTIEHVKYNGTNCLKEISLKYTIYEDLDIVVAPYSCNIDFTHSVSIYLNYVVDNQNEQIQIQLLFKLRGGAVQRLVSNLQRHHRLQNQEVPGRRRVIRILQPLHK